MKNRKKTIHQIIIYQLRKLRTDKGYSQDEIAKELGIDQTTYGRYESGKVHISATKIYHLAFFYEVEIGFFYGMDVRQNQQVIHMATEINRLKEYNNLLSKVNQQLTESHMDLENDFIRQISAYLVKKLPE